MPYRNAKLTSPAKPKWYIVFLEKCRNLISSVGYPVLILFAAVLWYGFLYSLMNINNSRIEEQRCWSQIDSGTVCLERE